MKRIISFLLALALVCIVLIPTKAHASEDYRTWAQADSRWSSIPLGYSSVTVGSHGCLVTSVTKLIIQAGLRDSSTFNVATLADWLNNHSGYTQQGGLWYAKPSECVSGFAYFGQLMSYGNYSSSAYNATLLNYINAGYHMVVGVNGCGHWVAIDEAKSLSTGSIYIMDSSPGSADVTLASRYPVFNAIQAYKGGNTPSASHIPVGTMDGVEGGALRVHVTGWVYDRDDLNRSVTVHVYVGSTYVGQGMADQYRPDVDSNASHLGVGKYHGYDLTFSVPKSLIGTQGVTVYAIDEESDNNPLLSGASATVEITDSPAKVICYNATGSVWKEVTASGDTVTLSSSYPKKSGYYFSGWSYSSQNATLFDVRPGDTISVTDGYVTELYPIYVSHAEAISGKPVPIYNIDDFKTGGYKISTSQESINIIEDGSYWTEWSDYSTTVVTASSTVEVRTMPMYRYYYYLCPSCGAHEPFYGTSDCGAQIPSNAGHVGWFTTPYAESNPMSLNYTQRKYYTTSLGDGGYWIFSSGNVNDTAIGTTDADGSSIVICEGYSSRKYIERQTTKTRTYTAYKIVPTVKITAQLVNGYAPEGKTASTTVKATGDGLTYTWYHKNANASAYAKSSVKSATYSTTITSSSNGRYVYCVVTDRYGNTVQTNKVRLWRITPVKLTTSLVNGYAPEGKVASTTVQATGDGLTYTWYHKNANASAYAKSSVTGATYSTKITSSSNGRYVYCVVTDKYGNTVQTNKVRLWRIMPVKLTTSLVNGYAPEGKVASTTVQATGDGLTYTWYHKNANASAYAKSSVTGATYSTKITSSSNGRYVYCVITDKYGNSVQTNPVRLWRGNPAAITAQPVKSVVANGATASATVKATGDGITYTWYHKSATASAYVKASFTGATYSTKMSASTNGRMVYCLITDKYGNSVKTNVVTLKMK